MCFKKVNKSIEASDLLDMGVPILEEEEGLHEATDALNTAFDDSEDSDNEMPELEESIEVEGTDIVDTKQSLEMRAMAHFGLPTHWWVVLLSKWIPEDSDDDSHSISIGDMRKYVTILSINKKIHIVGFPKFIFGKALEAYLTDRTIPQNSVKVLKWREIDIYYLHHVIGVLAEV